MVLEEKEFDSDSAKKNPYINENLFRMIKEAY